MKLKKLKKKNVGGFVTARVFKKDLEALKDHGINVSRLIRQSIREAARRIKD